MAGKENLLPAPLISVVIPAYNEEGVLQHSIPKIVECLLLIDEVRLLQDAYEVLVINDGSADGTELEASNLAKKIRGIRLITLTQNAGHMRALEIGLLNARGKYIVSLDADLQDPPEYIPRLYKTIKELGVDCVQTVRTDRSSDSFLKRNSAAFFYWTFRKIIGVEIIPHAADFRILTELARDKILQVNDKDKVFRFLIPILRITTTILPIHRDKRVSGASKYHFRAMAKLATYSILNYTPLLKRMSLGFFVFSIFGAFLTFGFSERMDTRDPTIFFIVPQVWLIILFSLAALISLVLFSLDKYMARKKRPPFSYTEVV